MSFKMHIYIVVFFYLFKMRALYANMYSFDGRTLGEELRGFESVIRQDGQTQVRKEGIIER
jgi:hypothetical protein